MGKFRWKLKRNAKGKTWAKGTSEMKHRLKAKSRFFQPNISLAPPPPEPGKTTYTGGSAQTRTASTIRKHQQGTNCSGKVEPDEEDSSVTRPLTTFETILRNAGFKIVRVFKQQGFT